MTYIFRKFGHLSDTAGVVGNRTVCINCNGHSGSGQHTYGSQCNTVQAGKVVCYNDADSNEQNRPNGGHHTNGQSGNDGGSRTGLRLFCNALNELVCIRSINFSELTDDNTNQQTGDNCPCIVQRSQHILAEEYGSDNYDNTADIGSHVQSLCRVHVVAAAYCQDSQYGCNQTDCGNQQREQRSSCFVEDGHLTGLIYGNRSQSNGRDDGSNIGFKQVGTHSGNVTYVITYVVGNNRRVSRIVFRDTGFYLTNQVRSHVCCLSINTSAHTGKQRN